jgi:hypothetical protein
MAAAHEMHVVIAGADAEGRSAVLSAERVPLGDNEEFPGFWSAALAETASAPPPARPAGRGAFLDLALAPGVVRWHVIDYGSGVGYPMHHTDTVDFDTILAGSIELTLDDGVHVLHAGDGAVIHGVDHAWRAGPDGCRLSVLSIGTPPPD